MTIVPTPGHPFVDARKATVVHADGLGIVVQFTNRYGHDLGTWEGPVSADTMLFTDAADDVLTEHGYHRTSVWRSVDGELTAPIEPRDRGSITETPEQARARRAREDCGHEEQRQADTEWHKPDIPRRNREWRDRRAEMGRALADLNAADERRAAADRFAQRLAAAAVTWVAVLVVAVDLSRGSGSDLLRTGREFLGTTGWFLQWLWSTATPGTALVIVAVVGYAAAFTAATGQPQRRGLAIAGVVVGSLAAAGFAIRSAVTG